MFLPADIAGLTPEEAYCRGRRDRIGGWVWRMTMLVLGLVGLTTLVSNFGLFLLTCMGVPIDIVETWNR